MYLRIIFRLHLTTPEVAIVILVCLGLALLVAAVRVSKSN